MSGSVWMFSDQIDDEDMDFMRHEFVTYSMASDYYGLGLKPVTGWHMNVGLSIRFAGRF